LISRIPITDISPAVFFGGEFVAVKAIAKESIPVSATIIIEGHETLTAEVCLYNAKEKMVDCQPLIQRWPGTDRYEGQFTVPAEGDFYFVIKASSTSTYRTVTGESEKYPVRADRDRALVGSWYEFFPRSEGAIRNPDGSVVSGTFALSLIHI
jgi:starch synthase (maltosyl-transferring)